MFIVLKQLAFVLSFPLYRIPPSHPQTGSTSDLNKECRKKETCGSVARRTLIDEPDIESSYTLLSLILIQSCQRKASNRYQAVCVKIL